MASVGTTPVAIGSTSYLIQNLGLDPAYVGNAAVSEETGVRLAAGEVLSIGTTNAPVHVVSEGTSDIRTLGRATGIFYSVETPA